MRFCADGPFIPDELLWQRDEGKVVFFCGAGVSRAFANLPNFFGLAEKVVKELGVEKDGPANKLIQAAKTIDETTGISGLVSADRIFGLMEREFEPFEIEEAVAKALKPKKNSNLKAHKILLDLATTQDGRVQLVTTNFDRLFEKCGRKLKIWQPPRLPDPSRLEDVNGIVYLHGLATKNYNGAEGDGFVLSTSQFGRAYLAEGWATKFIREILEHYTIVFIGYSADDPPVQYLLEALNKMKVENNQIYTFQSSDKQDAINRWHDKGVKTLPYKPENSHLALWNTLEAWAERAQNPDAWYEKVIEKAKQGPEALQAFERGQVAHIVSNYEGAKKFAQTETPPPAEWLCVFDKYRRLATPRYCYLNDNNKIWTDPFSRYGLDSDTVPKPSTPNGNQAHDIPENAWDAFDFTPRDYLSVGSDNLRSFYAGNALPALVKRFECLGWWLVRVSDQPAALWWAVRQKSLSQHIQSNILWQLEDRNEITAKKMRQAWSLLFEAWKDELNFNREACDWDFMIQTEGWNFSTLRQFAEIFRPRLSVEPSIFYPIMPPKFNSDEVNTDKLFQANISYHDIINQVPIPAQWCRIAVKTLRQNLERAILLEKEIGVYGRLQFLAPIIHDEEGGGINDRIQGLSGMVIYFSKLFDQLCKIDTQAAKQEFLSWPVDDDHVFAHLRIWAAGKEEIVSNEEFGNFISCLSDIAFWSFEHQRDLLLVLKERWKKLDASTRQLIERKLLTNSTIYDGEDIEANRKYCAWKSLTRIEWLKQKECELSESIKKNAEEFHLIVPEWKKENVSSTIHFFKWRRITTNTNCDALLTVPISELLSTAEKLNGRSDGSCFKNAPFEGLVEEKPIRAFAALSYEAKQENFPAWAWQTFFYSDARKNDKSRFIWLIANRLTLYPDHQLLNFFPAIADWVKERSEALTTECLPTFFPLLSKLVSILKHSPENGKSNIGHSTHGQVDWLMEAINSPAGNITRVLLNDPRLKKLDKNPVFPKDWLTLLETLLKLPDGPRQYAIIILFHNLCLFFDIVPEWTKAHLLPILQSSNQDDRDAAWCGFLFAQYLPSYELFTILKKDLLDIAIGHTRFHPTYDQMITDFILFAWDKKQEDKQCISDEEMRALLLKSDDAFRTQILKYAQQWPINENNQQASDIWKKQLPKLLKIWPRQKKARSAKISATLCNLLFASGSQFPALSKLVQPLLLEKIENPNSLDIYRLLFSRSEDNIIDTYPEALLEILDKVLPENASQWPQGMDKILERIRKADANLKNNKHYISLKFNLDSR